MTTTDPTGKSDTINRLRWVLGLAADHAGMTITVGVVNKMADALDQVLRDEGYVLVRLSQFEAEMTGGAS
jgi:hemolysin activation/secretion protein